MIKKGVYYFFFKKRVWGFEYECNEKGFLFEYKIIPQ